MSEFTALEIGEWINAFRYDGTGRGMAACQAFRELATARAEITRLRTIVKDANIVCSFVAEWWPGLEGGISWPQSISDTEIFAAAVRVHKEAKGDE